MEFQLLAEMLPLQARLVSDVLQVRHTGELLVPQAARGTCLQALLPLLRPERSPSTTPGTAAGNLCVHCRAKFCETWDSGSVTSWPLVVSEECGRDKC
jgi:hypothetical protein